MATPVTVYDTTTGGIISDDVTVFDPQDVPLQAGSGETAVGEKSDAATEYFPAGARTSRPSLSVPETHTTAADTDLTLTGIPDGTDVYTDDVLIATTDGGDLVLTFPESGVWRVRLEPPFPTRAAYIEVTVT